MFAQWSKDTAVPAVCQYMTVHT